MNPLHAVVANIDRMNSEPDQSSHLAEAKEDVARAVAASRRMGSYLDMIRKQLLQGEERKPFSPLQEIRDAMDILSHKARVSQVSLVFKDGAAVELNGSALKFHRIVLNLVANAIESYENVSPARTGNRKVFISLEKDSPSTPGQMHSNIVLTVQDFGCGMSDETTAKMFEPFYTTRKSTNGSGIGLSTVQSSVINDFNGTIAVSSTEGFGTTITVNLPQA
jgi:signal transduction histidine kinase